MEFNMSHVLENLSNNHLVKCATVYVFFNKENTDLIDIHCTICKEKYSEWPKFYGHLQDHCHLLKRFCQNTKNEEEMYLKTEYLEEEFQLETNENLLNECNIKTEDIVDKNHEQPSTDIEFLEENFKQNKKECQDKDLGSNFRPFKLDNCFFRLCTTEANTMFKFIELLRDQPCQWNYKNSNFSSKNKRLESTLTLTKQLNKHFNLHITPQGTRKSVLALMRWFENEYIRQINCQQNDYKFVCPQKEYFEKLLQFLPHEHLKPMNCEQCLKRFKSEHLLISHKHKHHNGQEVPFRCRFCGHGFIHQSSHKMHENRHIKINIWPCKNCPYQAVSKSDHIKHLATHSTQQPYKCPTCGLAYKTRSNLNVHMKSHRLPDYKCEVCQKQFYEKYRYKRHIWLHEEKEATRISVDNFTCEICSRRFTRRNTLAKHQLVHVQENYKLCSQTEANLQNKDVFVHFCNYCSLDFLYKEAYEDHMRLKHN